MRHHPPVSIRRLATGLVAVPALLLSALAVPSLVASASPEAATTAQDMVATAVTSAQPAIGDPRDVTQPRLPAVACATLPARLPGGTRIFSAADEAAPPDTARIQAALDSCQGGGGLVTNVAYEGTCMRAIQNLIVISPLYDPPTGTTIPWFKSVTIERAMAVHSVPGASSIIEGYSADFPTGLTLHFLHLDATDVTAQYANITLDHTNLVPAGAGVTDTTVTGGPGIPAHCTFPPFPGS